MSARAASAKIPQRTITVIIDGHGADLVSAKYKPEHVRILSAAGIPGCYDFDIKGILFATILLEKYNEFIPNPNENIPSIQFILEIQNFLKDMDIRRGYENLHEYMESLQHGRSAHNRRYIPLNPESFKIASARTTRTVQRTDNKGRFSLIKPQNEHKYTFEPKRPGNYSQGIYVIHMTDADNGSGIHIGNNLAEEKFNINSDLLMAITPSSIYDINMHHTNFVKRQLNKYNDLAAYYKIFLIIDSFTNQLDMRNWIDSMYPPSKPEHNTPEHKIYKFGCMKLFNDEPEFRQDLRACMCAKYLGDKFKAKYDASDVLKAVLERVHILNEKQQSIFQTGLKPEEYEKMLIAINKNIKREDEDEDKYLFKGLTEDEIKDSIKDIVNTCKEGRIINTMMPYIGSDELIDTVSLSTTVEYLKGLGYDNVNIIDFSCRVDRDATEAEMDAAAEEERKSPTSPYWGGNINSGKTKIAKTNKQYKNKNKKTKKQTK